MAALHIADADLYIFAVVSSSSFFFLFFFLA